MIEIEVKVKKLHKDAIIPTYGSTHAAGFDLYAAEEVVIEPGTTKKVKLGLAFAIPSGFEVEVRPRSGISTKTKLRIPNAPGTVDADYRGEVAVPIENQRPVGSNDNKINFIDGSMKEQADLPGGSYIIRKHDRIAQGLLKEVPKAVFYEVEDLEKTERGSRGFGSTGVR